MEALSVWVAQAGWVLRLRLAPAEGNQASPKRSCRAQHLAFAQDDDLFMSERVKRPAGTRRFGASDPALKRRAIFGRPAGTLLFAEATGGGLAFRCGVRSTATSWPEGWPDPTQGQAGGCPSQGMTAIAHITEM